MTHRKLLAVFLASVSMLTLNLAAHAGTAPTLGTAEGGTGGHDAASARAGIGAAASGSNSDITSLSGLTTPLSAPQGGTGGNIATAGAVADGQQAIGVTATIAQGSNVLTVSTPIFNSLTKVGQRIGVQGAGATPTTGYISATPVTTQGSGYQGVATLTYSGSPTRAATPGVLMGVVSVTQTGAGTGCPAGTATWPLNVTHAPQVVPTVSATINGSGNMTAVSVVPGGYWVNDYPTASGVPALTGIKVQVTGCASQPTVTISIGVVGVGFGSMYSGADRGAGYSTTGITATFSGGSPSVAAVAGTPVIGTWTPPLDTTITAINSANSVTLAANAATGLSAVTTNVTWGTLNTANIQSAVNSGGVVAFPPGPGCYLTDQINLVSNSTLYGWGNACLLLEPASLNPIFLGTNVSNVEIYALTGTGDNATYITPSSGSAFWSFTGSANINAHNNKAYSFGRHCGVANSSVQVKFNYNIANGCEFGGGFLVGTNGDVSSDVQEIGNATFNTQWAGVGGSPVTGMLISENIINGSDLGWGDSTSGLVQDCITGYTADPAHNDITVTYNKMNNCGNNGIHEGADKLKIAGNTISGAYFICIIASRAPNTLPTAAFDLDIENNTCQPAVASNQTNPARRGILVRNYTTGIVSHNIVDTWYSGVSLQGVPASTGNASFTIDHNSIANVTYGVISDQKLQYSLIEGNTFRNVLSDMITLDNTDWSSSGSFPNFFNVIGVNVGHSITGIAVNEISGDYDIVSRQWIDGASGTVGLTGAHSVLGVAP